jgi:2-methylisocitrate lyase-like PEP mutase family enzyme
MEATTTEKRKALRKMMQGPGCHIAPSCNDGIQARLVEWLGFPLVHISGSGQHRSLGFADAGLLTLTEMINRAREIVEAVQLPCQRRGDGLRQCGERCPRGARIRARRRRGDSY